MADVRAWLAEVTARGGWAGGVCDWFGSSLEESSPFNTPWRRVSGALWDIGPHVISLLWAALGPVTSVTADSGPADVAHLILHHRGGATSTATVTQSAGAAAAGFQACLWGAAASVRSGRTDHPCDVRFGRDVGRVVAGAQRQIDERRAQLAGWHPAP